MEPIAAHITTNIKPEEKKNRQNMAGTNKHFKKKTLLLTENSSRAVLFDCACHAKENFVKTLLSWNFK